MNSEIKHSVGVNPPISTLVFDRYHPSFALVQRMQLFNRQQNAGYTQATDIPIRDSLS